MKLSKETLSLIKNFASINTNLLIKPGNKLATIAPNKTIYGEVEVEETFPSEFGIYDLNEFLGVLSIFSDPDLEFGERSLTISEGKNRIRYMPADGEVLIAPKSSPKFPADAEVKFELTSQNLVQITRAASALKVGFATVKGDGQSVQILVHDKANPNTNQFKLDVGETEHTFEFHIKVESLKMVQENYDVIISSKKFCKFVGNKKSYLVTCEADSKFGG